MKKHLFGLALFSLIVGTAVFVVALTTEYSQPERTVVYEVSKKSCWKNVRQNSEPRQIPAYGPASIKVSQAVLNEKTRQLRTSFNIQRETPSTQKVKIRLTFVNSNSYQNSKFDGTVYTEYIDLSPDFSVDNSGHLSMVSSYQWLDNLKVGENLYVKAEAVNASRLNFDNSARRTSFEDFTPVLLVNKNRDF